MDKELQDIIKRLQELGASTREIDRLKKEFQDLKRGTKEFDEAVKQSTERVEDLKDAASNMGESFADLTAILSANVAELSKANTPLRESLKTRRGIRDISKELLYDEQGITRLSEAQLKSKLQKLQQNKQDLIDQATAIENERGLAKVSDDGLQGAIERAKIRELGTKATAKQIELAKQEAENEANLIKAKREGFEVEQDLIEATEKRLAEEEKINKTMGLTGDLVKSLGGFMQKLGLDSKIVSDAVEESQKAMREAAKDGSKLKAAFAGLGPLAKGFGKALVDPATIGTAILNGFLAVNKAQVESIRLTGSAATSMAGLSGKVAATSEVIAVAAAATRQMGIDANQLFGNELLTNITYLQHELGLTAEQAGRFGSISKLTGKTTKDINKDISEGTSEMNKLAKSGVPLGIVLQDVLNASDDITASLGNNPKAIAKAATAARALGMDLAKVNNIADGLLDFESSIEAELEAQLLTGKNINLSKARELALNNDLEGVARELAKNGASAAEFADMNRVQQEAMAKAMGMSREELGKMVMTQAQANKLTDEQRAKIQGVTVEQLKSEDVMHRLNRSLMMLGESFAPMLEVLAQVVSVIVKPISMVAGIISGIFAAIDKGVSGPLNSMAKLLGGAAILGTLHVIKMAFTNLFTGGLTGMKTYFKALGDNLNPKKFNFKSIKESITGLFSKDSASKITKDAQGRFRDAKGRFAKNPMSKTMDKGNELTGKIKDKTKGANKAQGPGGFLRSLADGLKAMGTDFGKIMKGTLALGLAAVAVVGPFALALRTIKDVDPAVIAAFSVGVGVLGGSLALLGKMSSNVIKGGIALAAAGAGILAASFGFSLLEGINPDVVKAVVGSLLVLGTGAALLGALAGNIMTGAAALGILGLAMVPAAFALSLLENVDISKIVAFSIAVPLLGLAAAGLGFLSPFIMAGAAALGVLGLAMIPLAGAFALLGAVDVQGVLGSLAQFASMTPGLLLAGPALLGLSAGLMAFSAALAGGSLVSGLTGLLGGGVMGDLEALAAMAGPLSQVGVSLTAIAAGLSGIALALSTLETEKINELKGLVMTTAMAAPMVAATGAITDLISGIAGGGDEGSSNAAIEAKLDELIAAVKEGGDVYIDGNKAGTAMMLAQYKTA